MRAGGIRDTERVLHDSLHTVELIGLNRIVGRRMEPGSRSVVMGKRPS